MEQSNLATNRIEYVDVIKGIAILMVVIGHVCASNAWIIKDGHYNDVSTFVSCVHLPVFFFMSGLLMALTDKKRRSRWTNIYRKTKVLLVPYFMWAFVILPFCLNRDIPSLNFIVHPDGSCWYLIYVLVYAIIYELINIAIEKLNMSKIRISLLSQEMFMIISTIMIFLALYKFFPCESYKRLLSFSLFYYLGVVFYNHKLFVKISEWGGNKLMLCCLRGVRLTI